MAMNCLKYFILDVLFVFNDFCLAQTSTHEKYETECVFQYAISYYLIKERIASKGKY